jgi:hypothetical protein
VTGTNRSESEPRRKEVEGRNEPDALVVDLADVTANIRGMSRRSNSLPSSDKRSAGLVRRAIQRRKITARRAQP